MKSKTCNKCGADKPLSAYNKNGRNRTGRAGICRDCRKEYNRQYAANPATKKRYKASILRRYYGLTYEQYEAMLVVQQGRCAICNQLPDDATRWRTLHVDHCHKTNRVRGLLCSHCNTAIGKLKDDPALMRKAIAYVEAR